MTLLPEKDLLAGTKTPKTTTGEMKNAIGKVRDYLAELFGDDSMDKEKARQTLGIDLSALSDKSDIEGALSMKADKAELENKASKEITDALEKKINTLEAEIAKRGIPVGSIDYFATSTPPAGYLKADGSEVGRETYPELFTAIGTVFGEGNGDSTFNLPDLMGRFAQGSTIVGKRIKAGLPDHKHIEGFAGVNPNSSYGVATTAPQGNINTQSGTSVSNHPYTSPASLSNPIYGASDTVQPPALTLLPCIKAFDAATGPGLIDVTGLSQEIALKADKKNLFGIGQTYHDVTHERQNHVIYTNTSSKPLFVSIYGYATYPMQFILMINDLSAVNTSNNPLGYGGLQAVVPPGATYQLKNMVTIGQWFEMR